MTGRSSRHRRGGPVDRAFTIGMVGFMVWLAVFVADETHERVIGFGLACFAAIVGILAWWHSRRSAERGPSEMPHDGPTSHPDRHVGTTADDAADWESQPPVGVSTFPSGWFQRPDWDPVDRRRGQQTDPE